MLVFDVFGQEEMFLDLLEETVSSRVPVNLVFYQSKTIEKNIV